tara:strand:+ start:864 stop:1055 length:192 start_codon:yes stop_codon:yes gene_type:complete
MKGFFSRLSVITSWIGFGLMVAIVYNGDSFDEKFIFGGIVWFAFGVINYLFSGSFRLLPWVKK